MARTDRKDKTVRPPEAKTATGKPVGTLVEELRDLVTNYVKQETVDPAKQLGKTFGLSLAAGLMFGLGFLLALLAVLRVSQEYVIPDDATQASFWSVLPYGITIVVAVIIIAVVAAMVRRSPKPLS